jgi:hypothetical protein
VLDELVVTQEVLPPTLGIAGSHTVNAAGTGAGGTGTQLPDGLTLTIDLHTGTRSRSARGWMLWPGPSNSSFVSHNAYTSAWLSVVQNFANLLPDAITLGSTLPTTLNPVIYSRTRALRGESPTTFRTTAATLKTQPGWLRSRMTTP